MTGTPATQEALAQAQSHLDSVNQHLEIAERIYPSIVRQCGILRAQQPGVPEPQIFQQAMHDLFGDRAAEISAQIAHDLNDKQIVDAGEQLVQAKHALKEAGFNTVANRLTSKNRSVFSIKEARDAITHPEQKGLKSIEESKFPENAQAADEAVTKTLETLKATPAPATEKELDTYRKAVRQLEKMRDSLGHFNKPGGYRLTAPSDLTAADMKQAINMQEIHAGSYVGALKEDLKASGIKFDEHTFPGGKEPVDVCPGSTPGEHPLDKVQVRRDDLAHLDAKDELHPGALERANSGEVLHNKMPRSVKELVASLQPPPNTQLNIQPATAPSPPHTANPEPPAALKAPVPPSPPPATESLPPHPVPKPVAVPQAAGEASVVVGEVAEATSALSKFGKVAGPVGLVATPVLEAGMDGYEAYKKGEGAGKIAGATALGAGKGVVDTYVPGARDGFSDVIGKKDLTWADRALNAVDHVSQTATAIGGTAMAGEAIGVVTLPAEVPTAIGTAVAGLTNLGANALKAGLKVTGLAGKDQDGGYIYNGIAGAIHLTEAGIGKIGHFISGGEDVAPGTQPAAAATPVAPNHNTGQRHKP